MSLNKKYTSLKSRKDPITYDSPASNKVSMISRTLFKRPSSLISPYVILGPIGLDTDIWDSVLLRSEFLTKIPRIEATVCQDLCISNNLSVISFNTSTFDLPMCPVASDRKHLPILLSSCE